MDQIKYLDMFAGIGGFRSGLINAGDIFLPVGWCEIDPHAQKVYRALYDTGGEYFCSDARQINPADLPDIDLICGGFPCQSFSVAGKRRGFDDTRGTMFFEIARIAAAKRPAFLLLENVPGLLSHDGGRTFTTILASLSDMGYDVTWQVLNSKDYGVPQTRKRVYIVGYLGDKCSGQILAFRETAGTDLVQVAPGYEGERIYSPAGTSVTITSSCGGFAGKTGLYAMDEKTKRFFIDMNPPPTLTDTARCLTARQDAGVGKHRGERSGVLEEGPRAVITPEKEKIRQQGRRIKEPEEEMFTITAQDRHGVLHNGRVRKLTPRECWRLQGFSDEQFETAQSVVKRDAHLYKMAGNAVSVPVVTAVGRTIAQIAEKR